VNCEYYLSTFISGVYADLGSPPDYSLPKLSGWFLDNANLGKLNNLIGTHITSECLINNTGVVTGYSFTPFPTNDQLGIYKMLFDYEYFKNEARQTAKSSISVGNDWTNLREGDSSITKINKNEISKNFRSLSRDAKDDLDKAVKMYLKYNAIPDQVAGDDTQGISHYTVQQYQRTLN
jgi:hypothetical protein